MIIVDANVPLYAYDFSSPHHEPARRWMNRALLGSEVIGLPLVTLLAFVRIGTDPRIFREPRSVERSVEIVNSWLRLPTTVVVEPAAGHFQLLSEIAAGGQARGSLITDVHLAALTIEHGARLCTTDRGFARFRGLRLLNPLDG